jgi:hypothetical protein
MNSDHMTPGNPKLAGDPVSACHRRGWLFKPLLVATVVTTGVLGLAACGSSPSSPGVASAGSTTTTLSAGSSGGSRAGSHTGDSRLLKYSQCMRAHGITDFPDPSSNGSLTIGIKPGSDLNPHDPRNLAAQSACKAYSPAGNPTPAEEATANANALRYSQCMQSHGIADFPDPNGQGTLTINVGGDIDPNAATFKSAEQSCASLDTGFNTNENNVTSPPGSGQ